MNFLRHAIPMGLVKQEDLGLSSFPLLDLPFEPEYGNDEAHYEFVEKLLTGIAAGTSPLSQGVARAVEQFGQGARDLYSTIFPAWGNQRHHNRGVGESLHWATDNRDPMNSCQDYVRYPRHGFGNNKEIADWFGVPGGYLEGESEGKHQNIYEGTERQVVWVQNNQSLKNSLTICELASPPGQFFHPPEMDIRVFESRALSAVTGTDYDVEKLWDSGAKIYNLRRAIMVLREDRSRADDTVNPIWFKAKGDIDITTLQSLKGQTMSEPLDREQWESLKDRFYQLRGWDTDTGVPTRPKLEELGMKDIAHKLEGAGKLDQHK